MRAGKHVLIDKPMATSVAEANAIVDAARQAGMCVVAGPSHGFDGAVARGRDLIASGALGKVKMVTALNFTDFVYRPRRPEELDPARGGGVGNPAGAHGARRAH